MTRYIFLLGSLDTKGREVAYLRQCVLKEGGYPLVVDTGVLGTPAISADITRHEVAQAGGSTISELIERKDKTYALQVMAKGASRIVGDYLARGEMGGVLSIGGSRGTALSTSVMRSLPVGVPKLMVSTMAAGHNVFGDYVGTRDITMMFSVADVQGINAVTRRIFDNACAAIVGMCRTGKPVAREGRRICTASMLGVSTTLVGQVQADFEDEENEVIAFHAVGPGGKAMEELINQGLVDGVFDLTPGEILQQIVNSRFSAGPERMLGAVRARIPVIAAPGGVDFIIAGPKDTLPDVYRRRKTMSHTPVITLVRPTQDEIEQAARVIAERLSANPAPTAMILPRGGFGWFAMPGEPLHDPQGDRAFIEAFKQHASSKVEIIELDTHLNHPQVGQTAVEWMRHALNRGR